jgi:hypothetical protein
MNREQAERINDHLLDACAALERAGRAIAGLGKAERLAFDEWLDAVIGTLEDELLQPIYDQHPDLEPPAADWEEPTVISELVWADVRLPPSVTEQQLDAIIFSILEPRWQKTAAVAILADMECKRLGLPISGEVIAARLKVLSDTDRIEGIGDLRMWRHSDVRLKD